MLQELKGTIWYSILMAIVYLIIGAAIIGVLYLGFRVFVEPQQQHAYEFKVSNALTDWCGASPTDSFNQGTLAQLKTYRDGEPDRFSQLPFAMRQNVDAAVRGDREAACGGR